MNLAHRLLKVIVPLISLGLIGSCAVRQHQRVNAGAASSPPPAAEVRAGNSAASSSPAGFNPWASFQSKGATPAPAPAAPAAPGASSGGKFKPMASGSKAMLPPAP